ncbi:MAG: CDGSH iron-sulfur domain-containing protein [Candidatus Mycalebacterium zealandia]|nr:MAG: CDGSH iron-sulfur domain-containing protein [Candidatus Mycalebacterium zealandia]
MSKPSIQIFKDGPIIVSGDFDLLDSNGDKIECGDKSALCRCGESSNKPFCDGTHKKNGFKDEKNG